jgi:hypothetical protein
VEALVRAAVPDRSGLTSIKTYPKAEEAGGISGMPKRRYISEDDLANESHIDVECPLCGAILSIREGKGRRSHRTRCPVCKEDVTISLEKAELKVIRTPDAE